MKKFKTINFQVTDEFKNQMQEYCKANATSITLLTRKMWEDKILEQRKKTSPFIKKIEKPTS